MTFPSFPLSFSFRGRSDDTELLISAKCPSPSPRPRPHPRAIMYCLLRKFGVFFFAYRRYVPGIMC